MVREELWFDRNKHGGYTTELFLHQFGYIRMTLYRLKVRYVSNEYLLCVMNDSKCAKHPSVLNLQSLALPS